MLTDADPHGHVSQRHNRRNAKVTTAARTLARLAVNPGATTPQEGMCSWALGSSSRRKHLTPRHKRHNASATTVAQAWASLGASPGASNATRRCTSLGAGLHRPTRHPRPHPDAPHRENDNSRTCVGKPGRQPGRRKRHKEVYLLGRWAPQAGEHSESSPPHLHKRHNAQTTTAARAWASLGASPGAASATRRCNPLGVGLLRKTKPPCPRPDTPGRQNDNRRTCVGELGRRPGRPKCHKEVYLLGRWASQALQPSTSSPPTINSAPTSTTTTRKGHKPYLLGRAGVAENSRSARSSCRATPQAAGSTGGHNATRTKTFLGVGHLGAQIHAVNPTSAIRRSSNGAGTDARCSLPLRPLNRAQHRKAHSCHHRVASEGYPLGESGVRSVCACWEPQGARASTQRGGCQVKRSCVCRRRSACHAARCVRPGRSCDTTDDPSRPLVDRPTDIAIRPPTASSNFERCTWSLPY